ncbi:MAG: hypothetical protein GY711_11715 [bacterium]|nr:hypothetical protein [bacterium]
MSPNAEAASRTESAVDAAVDRALDARRDPLADDAVRAALSLEPEAFERVARLSRRLELVAQPQRARGGVRAWSVAAGLVCAAGVAVLAAQLPARPTRAAAAAQITSFQMSVARHDGSSQAWTVNDNGRVTHERVASEAPTPEASAFELLLRRRAALLTRE